MCADHDVCGHCSSAHVPGSDVHVCLDADLGPRNSFSGKFPGLSAGILCGIMYMGFFRQVFLCPALAERLFVLM